ncbi:dimethyl sulfoxide reductase anchor subunit family protein [Paracraurococcus lichenis]|uniref:DmsC/YnfH family molybdoenzyme membrane anchor subunit n=1 Tax=Paracraurococcus lichenis TaxID=3064888 RepID=A0ABT9E6K9_9PROT|nr:DmsC/YnfH family molybdoenzyme membrane anchor subunit [Paracraurococcus sp. LOR1-02]MDO9711732.1 DmsC/YnfH family molybdoenzyme membrane anchor subunit [Paracraurococcus sp. LOR1-02]
MNPAPSIVFFTTASGAGYGLLFWLGLLRPLGLVPAVPGFALLCLAVALVLVTAGLASSLLHLGNPQRAWRALTQWRSSWLSREGVSATVTYVPALLFGYGLWAGLPGLATAAGLLAALGAAATVWCTGMIYASLRPIPQWHHPLVAPGYLLLSAYSGMALIAAVSALGGVVGGPASFIVTLGIAGVVLKLAYWNMIDDLRPAATAESATSLGFIGHVRTLDPPHTETNYLLREMGFRVARKHAGRLRRIALALGFGAPVLLALLAAQLGGGVAPAALLLAALLALAGLLIERWLMFAEATHTVTLYYPGG